MSINTKISLLALSLVILPNCAGNNNDTSSDKPRDQNSDQSDEGSDSSDDETKRPTGKPDGGPNNDDPIEPHGDAGAPPDESSEDDETSAPSDQADSGTNTNDDTEDPGQSPDEDPETTSFFMPTVEPDNTIAPRIRVDADGGIHGVYAGYAGGGAYYAYCKNGCNDHDDFDVVYFPTDGTVANAMLALTKDGKPRVLLSAYMDVTYASCDGDCTDIDNWDMGVVLEHSSDQEVTGEALALDKAGKPHFLSHTYRAYFGIGQKDPFTYHLTCNEEPCTDKDNWTNAAIATQIWEENHLLFDAAGDAHLGFVALAMEDKVVNERYTAYATCSGECNAEDDWKAAGIAVAYTDQLEAINLTSGVSLALTSDGHPRMLTLAKAEDGTKQLIYFECDEECEEGKFSGSILSVHDDINVGLDLTLDSQDHPRFVYTLAYNIFLAACDDAPCTEPDAEWTLHKVEAGSDMPPDNIILYPNCSVAAWFLHTPVIELDHDGNPIVGYQARDISGGVHNADPTKPDCVAGTDMTLTRMTRMTWE